MHFLTHAAPVVVCFAPHIESEIYPVLVVDPAACATTAAMANIAANKEMLRFMGTSGDQSLLALMMLPSP
jgi:hypothetical protein